MSNSQSAARRGLTLDDLARIHIANDPQISPDGMWIVYSQQRMDRKQDKYCANLWIVATDATSPPRQLTAGEHKDLHAVWAPDSTRIASPPSRRMIQMLLPSPRVETNAMRVESDAHTACRSL